MVVGLIVLGWMFWWGPVSAAAVPVPGAAPGEDDAAAPGKDDAAEDTRVGLPDRS
jgi:hypothetical protein